MGEVTFASANALLGGLTAGILQKLRDGSFQDGFARGAFGGAIAYGGRRLAVEDFWGAGLLARQVSAVGASISHNASNGHPSLSYLAVPLGPLTLHIERGRHVRVKANVDLYTTIWLLAAVNDERLTVDYDGSLSSGMLVFRTPRHQLIGDGGNINGQALGGLIVLTRGADELPNTDVFAHERVHVLQHDFARILWSDPAERWLAHRLPLGESLLRFVQPGVVYPLMQAGVIRLARLPHRSRPWEIEAEYLEHR